MEAGTTQNSDNDLSAASPTNTDANMTTNNTLEADSIPQALETDTDTAMTSAPPTQVPIDTVSTAEPQLNGHIEPAPTPSHLANGSTTPALSTPALPPTTSTASAVSDAPLSAPIAPAPPASNIPAPAAATKAQSPAPAPTRGSTPLPQTGLGPSHIIGSANGDTGSATRAWLNKKVTPALLEGMKYLAREEPERPLRWLSDFLRERSREVEGE